LHEEANVFQQNSVIQSIDESVQRSNQQTHGQLDLWRSSGVRRSSEAVNDPLAPMKLNLSVGPWAALIAGILILVLPQLLNFIVAVYLILVGVTGLMNKGTFR
jgi:hypothetical protein